MKKTTPGRPTVLCPYQAGGFHVPKSITARCLTGAALTVGALTAALAVPATAADHHNRAKRPSVEINRVRYDSPGRDTRTTRSLNAEWVDLTDNTRRAVNLDG
ncbi:hypothetical protein [Streptomyces sp. NPDC005930]|uniref:hypothetical protein n=1 Tax=Streptomyces sp. NPDC005930 TaxID=3364736 RepID=UPI0036CC8BCC